MIVESQDKLKIQQKFYVELPNSIENGFNIFQDKIKNLSNYNDILAKLEDYTKTDVNAYRFIISGLLHGILFDVKKANDYFQYLFVINKDNFDFLLINLISLIEWSHLKLTTEAYLQIFQIFDKLIHMNNQKLIDLIIVILRVFFVGNWLIDRLDFYKYFLSFLKSKLNWIASSSYSLLSGIVFIKILRLTSENHYLIENQITSAYETTNPNIIKLFKVIVGDEVYILSKLWAIKREEIIGIGKELIRQLISVGKANIPEIKTIIEDISKNYGTDNTPIYLKILDTKQPYVGFNPFIHVQIPPIMEKMIAFILTDVKRTNYIKYFNWMCKKFQISNEIDKSIYVDLTRYIVTCFNVLTNKKAEYTPRWLVLGYLLKNCRNEIFLGEIKQAIFFDWLFFNKERDHILLIEPGALVIFNSVREFPELTMELIEFLEVYSENFDLNQKSKIKDNISDAFKHAETVQMIPYLKSVLKEEKIAEEIKKIYGNIIKVNKEEELNVVEVGRDIVKELNNILNTSLESEESNMQNKIFENISETGIRTVQNEFFLHSYLTELISPITWKNFINYKSKIIFKNVLEEICKNFIIKTKSLNLLDIKSINSHPYCIEVFTNFAIFYLNFFKDELLSPLEIETDDDEQIQKQNNFINFYIVDFIILKFFEKNEKEFNILIEFVKKIIEIFPQYLVKIIFYFSKKANILEKGNKFSSKNLFTIFLRICDGNTNKMKEKLNQFVDICIDNMEIKTINYFLENCHSSFNEILENDYRLKNKIQMYTNSKIYFVNHNENNYQKES